MRRSKSDAEAVLSPGPVPRHVAIIMDGNGRWAQVRGKPRLYGHAAGAESVRDIVTAAREAGIEALTLYAFSSQNWARPPAEVAGLMRLLFDYLVDDRDTLLNNDIRLASIGEIDRLPDFVRSRLREVEKDTAAGQSMVLTLALSYGGREELVKAARSLAEEVAAGRLDPTQIDEAALNRKTFGHDLPPLDLIIRTSGELRLSNFLLWQAAYAELIVTDTLWPDFRRAQLFESIETFRARERRFGQTGDQIRAPSAKSA